MKDSRMLEIALASGGIGTVCLAVFLYWPGVEVTAFSMQKFLSGDWYRIVSFMYSHVTINHLYENMIALALAGVLAWELELTGRRLFLTFAGVSAAIALMESPLFPGILMAGASVGIAALLGLLALQGKKYLPVVATVPVFMAPMIIKYFFDALGGTGGTVTIAELVFHATGFAAGMIVYPLTKVYEQLNRKTILQVNEYEAD